MHSSRCITYLKNQLVRKRVEFYGRVVEETSEYAGLAEEAEEDAGSYC